MYEIKLRSANEKDIPAIIELYQGTVRSVNARDYTPEQISVWASGAENIDRWKSAIAEQYFVIAESGGMMLGFGSIAADGYIDFLYVHKDHRGRGVAKALLNEIERRAKEQHNAEIYSHVSITAKGLFERMGYLHNGDINDIYKGVLFVNALMVKKVW